MGNSIKHEKIVLLFDSYHTESQNLRKSFQLAECDFPVVVIEENGFLPKDVQSVYGYFLGDYENAPGVLGRPRYFNEIPVPDFWEISGSGLAGKVSDLFRERARIFYAAPNNKRQVQTVEWLDEQGTPRYADHYNCYGEVYARTTYDSAGKRVLKSYFAPDGKEVIVENFVTSDIILNDGTAVRIFNNKTELVAHFLHITGYDRYRLFFNSLSIPFFVSCYLADRGIGEKQDILFWQEPIADSIPGNMQMILQGRASRTQKIMVQKRHAYQRLMELGADPAIVQQKGFVYPFRRENKHRPAALICTNSDQIEQCEKLVTLLPQLQFHIAALTEMSPRLMAMGRYENVRLYPTAKSNIISQLFRGCDLYLDINHANEIVSATKRAFLHNQLIFAFSNTLHNQSVVDERNVFAPDNAEGMAESIAAALNAPERIDRYIQFQHEYALAESPESFLEL